MTSPSQKSRFHVSTAKVPRSVRVILMILAAFLIFGGPTYLIFVLRNFLPYTVLISLGLISFLLGLILFMLFLSGEGKQKLV